MTPQKPAPVVAELGRPETPEETAARKAQNSVNHRSRQTVNNLVYSLIATLVLVGVIILFVPRGNSVPQKNVDYSAIAAEGQGTEPNPLADPPLPKAWTSNSAQLRQGSSSKVDEWYIGLLTPSEKYIGFSQGFNANQTWLATLLHDTLATDTVTIGGIQWTVYDNRSATHDVGNAQYALTTEAGASTYVLYGNAKATDFETVAKALTDNIRVSAQEGE